MLQFGSVLFYHLEVYSLSPPLDLAEMQVLTDLFIKIVAEVHALRRISRFRTILRYL